MDLETATFIQDLFARCPMGSYLTLTAIHPDGDRPSPSRHVPLGDWVSLERTVERLMRANERGWGAYIGVAPRTCDLGRWSRGGKSDLACLPALFADIDDPQNALVRLGWFELPASCVLESGRGYHAYWFLKMPTTDFVTADRALHGLAQHLGGDEALSVAQSMRLAGSINTKPAHHEARCTTVSYHPDWLYDLSEFQPLLARPVRPLPGHARWVDRSPDRPHPLVEALTEAVLRPLDGYWRPNGFIGARCPLPHLRDRPGKHFSYNPQTGWGVCFGKHGKLSRDELCQLLGVTVYESVAGAA